MSQQRGFLLVGFLATAVLASGCGKIEDIANLKRPSSQRPDSVVVKSRALMVVETDGAESGLVRISTTQPISVINDASVRMTVSNADFTLPVVDNSIKDFGFLEITELFDNNVRVCGDSGKEKCTRALFRVYTTGIAGSGLYNTAHGYGVPLLAGLTGSLLEVGLNTAGAVSVQSLDLPHNKNVVRLSDFSPAARYNVQVDFTNAGAGSFATTLVLEYGLSLE